MKELTEVFNEKDEELNTIKISSAGLVWKYLGKEILINLLQSMNLLEQNKTNLDEIVRYNRI